MPLALDIIERGYLPAELPPVLHSRELSAYAAARGLATVNGVCAKHPWTRGLRHSLARPGGLRRTLTIPNPVSFLRLCEAIEDAWPSDIEPLLKKTRHTSSRPVVSAGPRAFAAQLNDRRAELEVLSRSGCRFILATDIQNFFPSIYTHCIPWVLHGRAHAKANMKSKTLAGNRIDQAVRDGQDGQTMGLPIGPDSSWVLAEALLARVEEDLAKVLPHLRGHRFSDDITIATRSQAEAEGAMDALQSCLAAYELSLNPRKTAILQLPVPVEDGGIAELRLWNFRSTAKGQHTDLIAYFDRVAELIRSGRGDHVASYAVARLRTAKVLPTSWRVLEAQLLQLLVAEPSCAKQAAMTLSMLAAAGMGLSKTAVAHAAESLVVRHGPLGHSSEVSWALWLCLAAGATVSTALAQAVSLVDDAIVALLALHAKTTGLISAGLSTVIWDQAMTEDELDGPRWLLSYEAREKAWLPSMGIGDHRAKHPLFAELAKAHVSFYDTSALSLAYQPMQVPEGMGSAYSHIFAAPTP